MSGTNPTSTTSNFGPVGAPTAFNPLQGVTGMHGDCLGFFTQLQKCYVEADVPEHQCQSWRDDYVECKLHLKEARVFFCSLVS